MTNREKLEYKIAKQLVSLKYPHQTRTRGEMNEETWEIRKTPEYANIITFIDEYLHTL